MTDILVVDVAKAIKKLLPEYLQSWAKETISCLQCEKPSVLKQTVNGMAKYFEDKKNAGKYRRWHCLTCGDKCGGSGKKLQDHLRSRRQESHCYGQKRFKAEVKRVRKIVKRSEAEKGDFDVEALKADLLLLRVGMALKYATLVHLNAKKAEKFEEILGDL